MDRPIPASQVRRFVDGELDATEAAALRERLDADPALHAAVRHEQALRERVADVLPASTPATPVDLEHRIRAAIRAEPLEGLAGAVTGPKAGTEPEGGSGSRWWGWLVGPQRANVYAVAAVLAIVVGAVVVSLRLPKIDQWGQAPESNLAADMSQFLEAEHGRCATSSDHLELKLAWCVPDQAEDAISQFLGLSSFEAPDISDTGYAFSGAGPCGVPGVDRSVHMLYRRAKGEGPTPMASVWAVLDDGHFDSILGPGAPGAAGTARADAPWVRIERTPGCDHEVWCRSDGRLVYFLVCCDDRDLSLVASGLSKQTSRRVR